jgi:hypothetical protein
LRLAGLARLGPMFGRSLFPGEARHVGVASGQGLGLRHRVALFAPFRCTSTGLRSDRRPQAVTRIAPRAAAQVLRLITSAAPD